LRRSGIIIIVAALFLVGLLAALRATSRENAEAESRAGWKSRGQLAGCFVVDDTEGRESNAVWDMVDRVMGCPPPPPTFRVFVPNLTAAELVMPLLAERTDIQLVNYHLEDVPAATVERMKAAAAPKTFFQGYNPPQTWPTRMGRHLPGRDFEGAKVSAVAAVGQSGWVNAVLADWHASYESRFDALRPPHRIQEPGLPRAS
jgi:hypothetical protein